jgi:hypothetical protein
VSIETPSSLPDWSVFDRGGRFIGRIPAARATPLRPPAPEYRKLGPQGIWSYVLRPREARPGQKLPTIVSDVRRAARQPCRVQRSRAAERAVARRSGLPGGGVRQPGHPAPRPGVGTRHPRQLRRRGPRRSGDRAAASRAAGPGGGPLACGHHRLVLRRVRGGTRGAEAAGRLQGRGGGRAGDRPAQLRHLLHRAVPRVSGGAGRRLREELTPAAGSLAGAAAAPGARDHRRQRRTSCTRSSSPTGCSAPGARTSSCRSRGTRTWWRTR